MAIHRGLYCRGDLAVVSGTVSCADFNNDGRTDILLSGKDNLGNDCTRVYRNDGPGAIPNSWKFTDINAGFIGLCYIFARNSASWGDYNNDGRPDILLTGYHQNIVYSIVYRNDGPQADGSWKFTNINTNLLGLARGAGVWGDYDNDGDLDIAITGVTSVINPAV